MTIKQAIQFFNDNNVVTEKVKGGYKVDGRFMHWQLAVCRAEKMKKSLGA
jgi:hypothetical protein